MPELWKEFFDEPPTKKRQEFIHFVHAVQQTTITIRKSEFTVRSRIRISKYDLHFWKGYKPQITQDVFEIVPLPSTKPTTYTIEIELDENSRGGIYRKALSKLI